MERVTLDPGLPDGRWAYVGTLRGRDEMAVEDATPAAATALLDRLLVDDAGTSVGRGRAAELAVCDRDRLLAQVYRQCFGDRVESTIRCRACGEAVETSFSLADLVAHRAVRGDVVARGPADDGSYALPDGRRFRLPTTVDERSVVDLDSDAAHAELRRRCVVEGDPDADVAGLLAAMEEVGARLDVELEARCPECEESQAIRFDMTTYLMRALAQERIFLTREVHAIASSYGWSLDAILDLSRADRRAFVRHIEAAEAAETGAWR